MVEGSQDHTGCVFGVLMSLKKEGEEKLFKSRVCLYSTLFFTNDKMCFKTDKVLLSFQTSTRISSLVNRTILLFMRQ